MTKMTATMNPEPRRRSIVKEYTLGHIHNEKDDERKDRGITSMKVDKNEKRRNHKMLKD